MFGVSICTISIRRKCPFSAWQSGLWYLLKILSDTRSKDIPGGSDYASYFISSTTNFKKYAIHVQLCSLVYSKIHIFSNREHVHCPLPSYLSVINLSSLSQAFYFYSYSNQSPPSLPDSYIGSRPVDLESRLDVVKNEEKRSLQHHPSK